MRIERKQNVLNKKAHRGKKDFAPILVFFWMWMLPVCLYGCERKKARWQECPL